MFSQKVSFLARYCDEVWTFPGWEMVWVRVWYGFENRCSSQV